MNTSTTSSTSTSASKVGHHRKNNGKPVTSRLRLFTLFLVVPVLLLLHLKLHEVQANAFAFNNNNEDGDGTGASFSTGGTTFAGYLLVLPENEEQVNVGTGRSAAGGAMARRLRRHFHQQQQQQQHFFQRLRRGGEAELEGKVAATAAGSSGASVDDPHNTWPYPGRWSIRFARSVRSVPLRRPGPTAAREFAFAFA